MSAIGPKRVLLRHVDARHARRRRSIFACLRDRRVVGILRQIFRTLRQLPEPRITNPKRQGADDFTKSIELVSRFFINEIREKCRDVTLPAIFREAQRYNRKAVTLFALFSPSVLNFCSEPLFILEIWRDEKYSCARVPKAVLNCSVRLDAGWTPAGMASSSSQGSKPSSLNNLSNCRTISLSTPLWLKKNFQ